LRATCNVTQNVTFEWNPTQGLDNPTILNPLAAPRQTTTYTLIARSGNLKAIDSVTVTVIPIAQPTITESGGILTANVSGVGTIVRYTWYRDGSPIAGANNATYQPLAPGIFTVEIENEKGCRSISEPFEFKITSLEQGLFLEGHRLWIYPNPTTGTFAIQTTYPSSYSIRVIDALGKVILYSNATSSNIQQFDLSSFANGVYYIHLQTIAGNKIITKLVKH
ncbi:MAG: T9SS type A sorting domain-containing protein, partial [Bacteroidia bacterium]|nr:T9SS type A sorting domain-containing protein [Bacteroidia bacterium]MDW8158636.1 T9SS type A sorting domain-containing protein [Bacteroidia bacterium]